MLLSSSVATLKLIVEFPSAYRGTVQLVRQFCEIYRVSFSCLIIHIIIPDTTRDETDEDKPFFKYNCQGEETTTSDVG